MFTDPSLIVQSAVSSFNNAALVAPSFFWSAVLMLPLFALVYKYGNDFISNTFLADTKRRAFNFSLCIDAIIIAWLVFMHGNYDVLRDSMSWLPVSVAAVLFVVTASVTQKLKEVKITIPELRYKRTGRIGFWVLLLALVGFSGMHTWWGFLMQIAAFLCGIIAGARLKSPNPIPLMSLVLFAITTLVLMQPEFFRFGQLGSLSLFHLFFVLLVGVLVAAIIALRNINPRGRVHQSAYIKLKWMARILAGLCIVLFVLTESVPVFLGLTGVLFASFAMSVWHSDSVPDNLSKKLWAILLCAFGVMTMLPMITAFGILYWMNLPRGNVMNQSKFLL